MKCSCAQCRLSAYLDHDLDSDEERELREHLAQCEACSAELEAMRATLGALHGLEEIEPDESFYAGICDRIAAAGEAFATPERVPFWRRLVPDFSSGVLRPAFGVALGLVAGVLLTTGSPETFAFLGLGAQTADPGAPAAVYRQVSDGLAASSARPSNSPLAEIALPPLGAAGDTLNVASEPEYVLEPYVTDPHGGLVPADRGYGQSVTSDWDSQNDVFITF